MSIVPVFGFYKFSDFLTGRKVVVEYQSNPVTPVFSAKYWS